MSGDVPHLGTIEGRETRSPHPVSASPATHPGPAGEPSTALEPVGEVPERRSIVTRARSEVSVAMHDIRDAHRRGPKPNNRPLPQWVKHMAWVLDDAIEVPATGGRRVGIDGFITIIPGVGDAIGIGLSMVVVSAGVLAGVSWPTIVRMLLNVAFEGVVGLVPFAGVAFDMAYKANDRNVRLMERDLADRKATRRSSLGLLFVLLVTSIAGFVMMFLIAVLGIAVFAWILWRMLG